MATLMKKTEPNASLKAKPRRNGWITGCDASIAVKNASKVNAIQLGSMGEIWRGKDWAESQSITVQHVGLYCAISAGKNFIRMILSFRPVVHSYICFVLQLGVLLSWSSEVRGHSFYAGKSHLARKKVMMKKRRAKWRRQQVRKR